MHFFFGQVFFSQDSNGPENGRYSITQADLNTLSQIRDRISGLTVNQSNNHASGQGGIAQATGSVTQQFGQSTAEKVKSAFLKALQTIANNSHAEGYSIEKELVNKVVDSFAAEGLMNSDEHVRCAIELIGKIFDAESANKFLTALNSR